VTLRKEVPLDRLALTARLEEVEHACRDLEAASVRLCQTAEGIRRSIEAGRPISKILSGGSGVSARREERQAWSRMNAALHDYRIALVQSLIDDERLTISEAARITGNARQVVSRLYHASPSMLGPRSDRSDDSTSSKV
jgi:hypothetical protein